MSDNGSALPVAYLRKLAGSQVAMAGSCGQEARRG